MFFSSKKGHCTVGVWENLDHNINPDEFAMGIVQETKTFRCLGTDY